MQRLKHSSSEDLSELSARATKRWAVANKSKYPAVDSSDNLLAPFCRGQIITWPVEIGLARYTADNEVEQDAIALPRHAGTVVKVFAIIFRVPATLHGNHTALDTRNCRWQRTNQLEVQKWGPVSGGHLGAKVVMATLIFRDDNQGKGVLLS